MGARKKDKKYVDFEISMTVTFREPDDGDTDTARNDLRVWLHNRLLNMKGCRAVDMKETFTKHVTVKAEDRGEEG